jgi:hypothetical protein
MKPTHLASDTKATSTKNMHLRQAVRRLLLALSALTGMVMGKIVVIMSPFPFFRWPCFKRLPFP